MSMYRRGQARGEQREWYSPQSAAMIRRRARMAALTNQMDDGEDMDMSSLTRAPDIRELGVNSSERRDRL